MTERETFTGWCCIDCLMILANGEDNPDWTEAEATAHHENMTRQIGECEVTLGLMASEHSDDCPNVWRFEHPGISGDIWVGGHECYCEQEEFSWSSCDTCGSHLGGAREAVTFWG